VYFAGHTLTELEAIANAEGYDSSAYFGDLSDPDTLPDAIDITGLGSLISISASGYWSHTPTPDSGPEGKGLFEGTLAQYGIFGISLLNADLNMLVGVFLSEDAPDPLLTPDALTLGIDDMTSPLLNQAFAIGAGPVDIYVPTDAARLYLGLHNGYEWTNNSGSVDVEIAAVPEPATMLLVGSALLSLFGLGRRKF
jgi:hypothetical protein